MSELTLEEITGVLTETRSKTDAAGYIREFLESEQLGKEVDLNVGSFVGKSAHQVKTALDNARKKVSDETGQLVIPGGTDVQVRIKQETNGLKGDKKVVLREQLFVINVRLVTKARKSNGNSAS